jgi:hypothetical protein
MSHHNYRVALIVEKGNPTNCIVIPDGKDGDKILKENPTWVEVTGMDPQPGVDNGWTYVNKKWVAPEPVSPTPEMVKADRAFAYYLSSDPVFFKWQRGEATKEEWLEAVEAVKKEYPNPEDK